MLDELTDKQRQAKDLKSLLASKKKLWDVVKTELEEVAKTFGDKRRTKIGRRQTEEVEFDPDAFRVKEDAVMTISTDGWIRRVGIIKDLSKARVREGDGLMTILGGSTVSPSGIETVNPGDAVMSFLIPDENELRKDITTSFCQFVYFFRSHEDGEAWISGQDGIFLLSLEEAFRVGQIMNAAMYKETMRQVALFT